MAAARRLTKRNQSYFFILPYKTPHTYHFLAAHPILDTTKVVPDYHASLPHTNVPPKHQIIKRHGAHKVQQLLEYLFCITAGQAEVLELLVKVLELPNQLLPCWSTSVLR